MLKKSVSLLLIIFLIFSLTAVAFCADSGSVSTQNYSLAQMRKIVVNALSMDFFMTADNGSWDGVEILKETPLYDMEGNLTSYCFDLKCGQQQSYMIVSANSENYPIMQFAPHGVSAYYSAEATGTQYIYMGAGNYYVQQGASNIMNLVTSEVIENDEVTTEEITQTIRNGEDYYSIASAYINGVETSNLSRSYNYEYRNLEGVPLYQWYLGCAPTATAMALDYLYDGLYATSSQTISVLADLMSTSSSGSTFYSRMPAACREAITDAGESYTSVAFPAVNVLNSPKTGATYNTLADYKLSILDNRPVVITMTNATGTSSVGYPSGFGDHVLTGVGYTQLPEGNYPDDYPYEPGVYLIVHTTSTSDGDVWVSWEGTALGNFSWLFIDP